MTPIADCQDCPWDYEAKNLVKAGDAADRHRRKEMHNVDVKRIATDGSGSPLGYPIRRLGGITAAAKDRFESKIDEHGPGRNWLDDDAEYHLWRAVANITNSDGAQDLDELADAVNHLAMARDIAVDERMQPDGGAVRRRAQGTAAQLAGVGDQDTTCQHGVEGCPGPGGSWMAACLDCFFEGGDGP